jgi:predicted  nucleic acid-binding Zn-ribbon protein
MGVSNKHMATFLLGAAAAYGAYKYSKLSDEEKEKLSATLKDKAHKLKDQAESTMDKAKEYFEELKSKGADALKEHMPGGVEEFFSHLFKKDSDAAAKPDVTTTTTTSTSV